MSGPTGGRAATVLGLGAGLCLAMSACTSGAGSPGSLPAVTPQPSASSVSSSTPSPSNPTDEQAIEAAVLAYFDAVNVAIASGNTAGLAGRSTPDCPCNKLVSSVKRVFSNGGSEGAQWTVTSVSPGTPNLEKSLTTVSYTTAPYRNVDGQGRTLESFPGYRIESAVLVVRRDAEWLIRDFETLSKAEIS